MIVWINGPYGGGKTQVAFELRRRVAGSVVCDPEEVGFGLHRMTPKGMRGDFQDFTAWRVGVVEVLERVGRAHGGVVLVPMTVVEPGYFRETVGRLREGGHDVRHFALLAERETVLRRLRERRVGGAVRRLVGRGARPRGESFALRNVDRCLEALPAPEFAEHIWTDELTVGQVAERIAASAGLTLSAGADGAVRGRLRRARVGLSHVRLF